jgi:YidC/Oxa1 family membrane protein insertase
MEVYKTRGINPFSGILLLIIQLPILWALYAIFLKGGLPQINLDLLYSFVKVPENINMFFFGIDVAGKSTLIALVAALTQFLQISLSSNKTPKPVVKDGQKPSFKDELSKSMTSQMKYVMPFMIFIVARSFPIVVSLYLITSNIFSVIQEVLMANKLKKQ